MSDGTAFQDHYAETYAQCYGCGRLNAHGLHIRSRWEGDETVCTFVPRPEHTAIPGYVYGGLIASLIDCHSTGTAAAAAQRARAARRGLPRCRASSPARCMSTSCARHRSARALEIRGVIKEIKGRKVVVSSTLSAGGVVCPRGEVVAVEIPEGFGGVGAG